MNSLFLLVNSQAAEDEAAEMNASSKLLAEDHVRVLYHVSYITCLVSLLVLISHSTGQVVMM